MLVFCSSWIIKTHKPILSEIFSPRTKNGCLNIDIASKKQLQENIAFVLVILCSMNKRGILIKYIPTEVLMK